MTAEESFINAYNQYADAIFRYCYYRVFDRERALELSQETFMKTWRAIADGKKIEKIRPFLYTTARNLIIDLSRKKQEQSLDKMMDQGFDPGDDKSDQLQSRLDADMVLEKLRQLDPEQRELIILRFVNELQPKEIAAILDLSANVVSVRLHRAVKCLKKLVR